MPAQSRAKPKLILASGSPRRRELIALIGWEVEVRSVDVDESEHPGEGGLDLARRLAAEKAREAAARFGKSALILAADTVVESGGKILGKPTSTQEAREMLMSLRGKSHQVHSAIALVNPDTGQLQIDACSTEVPMRTYSQAEVETYVQGGSPLDKAGAYGIQDDDFKPVHIDQMTGCYANVVGLPLCHVVRTMRKFGREPIFEVPSRCREHTGYDCGVFTQILRDEK
jgi:MAF protein